MSLIVIKAGILDTIQDGGRYGHQHLGINPGGAMDRYAMQVANALVGNNPGEAVIELHFPASVFMFSQPALIALSGADFSASINGEPVPVLHCIAVNKNDALQFHRPVRGARAYLSVSGGLIADNWLQSSSTNLKAKAGGHYGRSLQKGDELGLKSNGDCSFLLKGNDFKILPWSADVKASEDSKEMFVLPGGEWDRLTDESKEIFTSARFIIAKQSDRMGYRLSNNQLVATTTEEMISSAVSFGTIQLLPDGKLILLMADHQTTGGYPKIAHVITAHHSKLAQLKAGDSIWFRFADQQTAENFLLQQEQHLLQLQNACTFRLQEYIYAARH
ncbi:MAG: biotin-dependent carboxyltransferase family protein [Chitinophagaceae bacterium]